jgi:hypothetical protein
MKTRFWRSMPLMAAALMAGAAACDSPVDPVDPHGDPVDVELADRATGELLAYTHGDHWDGGLPHLGVGEEIAVNAYFLDADGDTIALGGEYTVAMELATGAPGGIIAISNHGDHVDIEGVAEGETQVIVRLMHGNHSDWDSPVLTIHVGGEEGEPVAVELYERGTQNLIAETHGTGEDIHWEGDFPALAVGEEIEVDVVFLTAAGEPITLAGDVRVEARIAEGADEGVVALASHTDHVDVEAVAAGTTEVIFAFWHGDHEDWAPPAIAVTVTSP